MNKTIPVMVVSLLILVSTTPLITSYNADANTETESDNSTSLDFDRYYYDGTYHYVTNYIETEGAINGLNYNSLSYTIIKTNNSEQGYFKCVAYNGTEEVASETYELSIFQDSVLIKIDNEWVDIEDINIVKTRVLPAVVALAGAIIAALTTEQIVAIAIVFTTTVIIIDQSDLISSIRDAFNQQDPEVIITEEYPSESLTIILTDGVPTAVHNSETNEASYFIDFETEFLQDLESEEYYPVCKLNDEMMIAPVPIERGVAYDILALDTSIYHTWTLLPDNAMKLMNNGGIMHVLPFYEECGMAEFPHWHSDPYVGSGEYSNSMSFFGLSYDDYEEETDEETR